MDLQKALFDAPIAVPLRPCPPTQPLAYKGPMIDWWAANVAAVNATSKAQMRGMLGRNGGAGSTLNSGFLVASTDDSATLDGQAANYQYAGHVFGMWGQGVETMPDATLTVSTAFQYSTPVGAAHGMMVSIFPYDGTSGGLTGVQTNEFEF